MSRWPSKLLTELCNPKQWPTISGEELTETGFPVYGANGQIGHYHSYNHEEPTILITCRGATCGTLNISPARAYVTGNAMALDNPDLNIVDFQFLYYALLGRGLKDTITGAAQPQITRANLSRVSIPTPPLSEQKRIVKLLDEADKLRKLRAQADQRTAALIPALFHEMFGEKTVGSKNWPQKQLSELTKVITKGTTPQTIKRQYMLSGTPFLRAENLQGGDIVLGEGTLFIDNITHNMLERSVIYPNDILLSIAGTIGRGAIVPEGSEEMNCNQAVAIIRPMLDLVEPRFLLAWLQSDIAQFQMGGAKVTQTIANLALGQIKQFKLRVPPMSLQKEFAQRVAEIHELEATQSQSRQRLDNLFQSLLHRAFNGEL